MQGGPCSRRRPGERGGVASNAAGGPQPPAREPREGGGGGGGKRGNGGSARGKIGGGGAGEVNTSWGRQWRRLTPGEGGVGEALEARRGSARVHPHALTCTAACWAHH